MAEIKTKATTSSVPGFIKSIDHEKRREDAKVLLKLFKDVTGMPAKLWNNNMVGFGKYHYKSDRSAQEGDWPLTGFSPRKSNMSIYFMNGFDSYKKQLAKLGKHKHSVGCLYINKLEDIDLAILKDMIADSVKVMKKKHNVK